MSSAKQIRDALLGVKQEFRSKTMEINGVEVEIRQPTVGERKELRKRATVDNLFDPMEFMVWSVIYNTFKPGTKERVFDDTDYEVFMGLPTGSFLDDISEAVTDLLNVDVEEKVKNSGKTRTK